LTAFLLKRAVTLIEEDITMRNFFMDTEEETACVAPKYSGSFFEAARPYITAFFIVTVLLSVWAGLCAA
jgi:hypothetical protein